ncbi:hypothetical protein GH741_05255 [Aquibacillus halophilus]|uniref:Uncharacterized protein n=1 Tax=Aquibacillus halophilus TaxID=930132 RepID=A0A6A8DE79_9BACI|nr:hypothetical protein [Aquibacillus halophilus]MRH42081.1 hypothetical protein [Aquibacillus halophilus]
MKLTIGQFKRLYSVVKEGDPSCLKGVFYSTSKEELLRKAVNPSKYLNDTRLLDIIWEGEGLYHIWHDQGNLKLVNSIRAFEGTTGMNHKIYLGNQEEIKNAVVEELSNINSNFLYMVWQIDQFAQMTGKYRDIILLESCLSNRRLSESEVFEILHFEVKAPEFYRVYEIRELAPEDLAEYFVQKNLNHLLV